MRINSIFLSVDGEANGYHQGRMSTFIRLQGCNLNCSYCDTLHAQPQENGGIMTPEDCYNIIKKMGCGKVTITGGEPMLQSDEVFEFTKYLYFGNYKVSIESNGSRELTGMGVGSWIVDYKLPGSHMEHHMNMDVFTRLQGNDFIKFVILDENDFERAVQVMVEMRKKGTRANFAFSPAIPQIEPIFLYDLMEKNEIYDAILNVQLHKIIGIK